MSTESAPTENPALLGLRNREAQLAEKLSKDLDPKAKARTESYLAEVRAEIKKLTDSK